ncbi:MAG: rod shape-determining protein MreC [Candidatus Colwellbacteria bacterium]|nr:rod shape-determining protein MreC [Candidatus Colwellbacteria bacterium]
MRRRYPITVFALILVLLVLGGGSVFPSKLKVSGALNAFFAGLSPYADLENRLAELERENADLKARLLIESLDLGNSIRVYSSYPFNNRSEIAIAAGSNMGVSEGDIVTYGEDILVGRVKTVTPEVSIVTTIFDPNFETAVRVGEDSTDALLRGGNELNLTLISPTAVLTEGTVVYTAGPDFPYGLTLGNIQSIEKEEDGMYKKVCVAPVFDIKTLKNVFLRF